MSMRALLPLALTALVAALPASAAPSIKTISSLAGGPGQVLWLGNQALILQRTNDDIMLWDQTQIHNLAHLDSCQPTRMVMTRDRNFLLSCSVSPRLLVLNNRGQVVETFPRPAEEAGLVSRSGIQDLGNLALDNITAMVQDNRGGTYIAVAGAARPDLTARGKGRIYYLSASRLTLAPVASKLDYPSGLALSPDGKTMFIAEGVSRQISRYEVQPGQLLNPQVFARIGDVYQTSATAAEEPWPASLAINSQGNVYVALPGDGRILVLSTVGKPLASLAFPAPYITGFSFSSSDRILYVTATATAEPGATGALYEMRL